VTILSFKEKLSNKQKSASGKKQKDKGNNKNLNEPK
jgi:hypothetical protein